MPRPDDSVLSGGMPGQFHADVRAYTNFYPFGMPQPGRFWDSSLTYRFGYTGMEHDAELKGGGHYTTLFRQYDPRLGRWWSTDPITHEWESPYAGMGGDPIAFTDVVGLDESTPLEPAPPLAGEIGDVVAYYGINWYRAPEGWKRFVEVRAVAERPMYDLPNMLAQFSAPMSPPFVPTLPAGAPYTFATIDAYQPNLAYQFQSGLDLMQELALQQSDPEMLVGTTVGLMLLHLGNDVHLVGRTIDYQLGLVTTPAENLWRGMANQAQIQDAWVSVVGTAVLSGMSAAQAVNATRVGVERAEVGSAGAVNAGVSRASIKRLKRLVMNLSKEAQPGITQEELDQLRQIAVEAGCRIRVDLQGIRGTGIRPHAQIEGLGPSIASRHIWLQKGVR